MPEILTESFCERCGTRYTFQSAAPKVGRLAKMRVLSRGLKNYVLSDETSLDEALADARSVDDREQSVEQLDAFHKTFNFCMSCRQYTCANCWNDREGRCLSCAPSLSVGLLPSSTPLNELTAIAGIGGNGHDPVTGHVESLPVAAAWPEADLGIAPDDGPPLIGSGAVEEKPVSRLEALFGREAAARIEADVPGSGTSEPSTGEMIGLEATATEKAEPELAATEAPAAVEAEEPELAELEADAIPEPELDEVLTRVADEPAVDAVAAAEVETEVEVEVEPADVETVEEPAVAAATSHEDEPEAPEVSVLAPEPVRILPVDPETDELAAAAAAQTHGLLDKFRVRPQPIPTPRPIMSMPSAPRLSVPYVPPVAPSAPAAPGAPQMPYAAVGPQSGPATPQPFGLIGRPPAAPSSQPYGAPVAMPYANPDPMSYGTPAAPPYAAPVGQAYAAPDAPVQPYPAPTTPLPAPTMPAPAPPAYPPFQPGYTAPPIQPQYAAPPPPPYTPPPAPSWRMVAPESPYLAPAPGNGHIGTPVQPAVQSGEPEWPTTPSWPAPLARGAEAVWAESTRDLLSRPEAGVSACFNCGLPLSATARFCRRCGTSQVAS